MKVDENVHQRQLLRNRKFNNYSFTTFSICDKTSHLVITVSSLTKVSRLAHEFITQMSFSIFILRSARTMWVLVSSPTLLPPPTT